MTAYLRSSSSQVNKGMKVLGSAKSCRACWKVLELSRVFELGVRRGVHHLVACREIRSLNSSCYVDCS